MLKFIIPLEFNSCKDKIPFLTDRKDMLIFSIILAAIVIIKHRTNIVRLVQGKENKLSFKKK